MTQLPVAVDFDLSGPRSFVSVCRILLRFGVSSKQETEQGWRSVVSASDLGGLLERIKICPYRLSLETPNVAATAPMLRGVWGAALRSLDFQAYQSVFSGDAGDAGQPAYVIRPAAPDPEDAPALDWFLLGAAADGPRSLLEAWNIAADRGLGPNRTPFRIRRLSGYSAAGGLLKPPTGSWPLSDARWPLHPKAPCSLSFQAPLRILRRSNLIKAPTLADLTISAQRRLGPFLQEPARNELKRLIPEMLSCANATPARIWRGERQNLHRYSGSQKRELKLHGVSGALELPEGPGALAPLLAAAQWTHIGKGVTVGLGQLTVEALPE